MSQLVPKADQMRAIMGLTEEMKGQFGKVLARQIGAERFVRICQTQIRTVYGLADCDSDSILGAFLQCATLNLEPGVNGQCWILPFKKKAQFVAGYQGLLDLAWRSEQIASVSADVVYKGDPFEYQKGDSPYIRHGDSGNRNPIDLTHSYAVLYTTVGGTHDKVRAVMNAADIAVVRPRGLGLDEYKNLDEAAKRKAAHSPWHTHTASMWKKSALKQVCKLGPSSSELRTAIALDDLHEVGKDQHLTFDATFSEEPSSTATGPVALPAGNGEDENPPPTGKCPACHVSLALIEKGAHHKPGCEGAAAA